MWNLPHTRHSSSSQLPESERALIFCVHHSGSRQRTSRRLAAVAAAKSVKWRVRNQNKSTRISYHKIFPSRWNLCPASSRVCLPHICSLACLQNETRNFVVYTQKLCCLLFLRHPSACFHTWAANSTTPPASSELARLHCFTRSCLLLFFTTQVWISFWSIRAIASSKVLKKYFLWIGWLTFFFRDDEISTRWEMSFFRFIQKK